jgi:hypothetical protein
VEWEVILLLVTTLEQHDKQGEFFKEKQLNSPDKDSVSLCASAHEM